jgi:hypothetical protein
MYPIYLQVCAGLANRLRATVSGICGAEDLGRNIVISWPRDHTFSAVWTDLFEPIEHSGVSIIAEDQSPNLRMCLSPQDWDTQDRTTINIKSYGRFHQTDEARWLSHLRSIKPKALYAKQVDVLFQERKMVGVHIRRTDNAHSIRRSPTSAFCAAMEEYPPTTLFYIATDDEQERKTIEAAFPGRCISQRAPLNRSTLAGIQGGLVDFLALARCSEILGSFASSFSEMAAAYGSVPLRVIQVP